MKVIIYLSFDGNGREALNFYANVLNGEIRAQMSFAEIPGNEDAPEATKNRLAHGNLDIGDTTLMISDTMGSDPHKGYSGFDINVDVETVEEAHALFAKISAGGTVKMPVGEMFWAAAFGTCVDKFGVPWMVNCNHPA